MPWLGQASYLFSRSWPRALTLHVNDRPHLRMLSTGTRWRTTCCSPRLPPFRRYTQHVNELHGNSFTTIHTRWQPGKMFYPYNTTVRPPPVQNNEVCWRYTTIIHNNLPCPQPSFAEKEIATPTNERDPSTSTLRKLFSKSQTQKATVISLDDKQSLE